MSRLTTIISAAPLAALVLFVQAACATVYYVDGKSGSDSAAGTSISTAFRTIGKGLDRYGPLAAGDVVRIRAGAYGRFTVSKSGTADSRILITADGDGAVVVDASMPVAGWMVQSGSVYRADLAARPTAVVVDDTPLFPEFSLASVHEGTWFYDSTARRLFLWSPGGGAPSSHSIGLVGDDAYQDAITVNASYVTLSGIAIRNAAGHGIAILGDYVRVEKCSVWFTGNTAITVFAYGTTASTEAQIVGNDVYHSMLRNWPRGRFKWGGWGMGITSLGAPNALIENNTVHKCGGEGIGGGKNSIIRGNVVYDNWSVNIYVDGQAGVGIDRNFIYSHRPDPHDLYNNGDAEPGDNRSLKRLRPEGIMTGDETSPPGLENITISNNVIVNCRRGIGHYAAVAGSGLRNVKVLNNTIVVASDPIPGEVMLSGIAVSDNSGSNAGSVFRNNIVYATLASAWLLYCEDAPAAGDRFRGLTMDHNLWYHAGRSDGLHWGPDFGNQYNYTPGAWAALAGTAHGSGDVSADPKFVNSTGLAAGDRAPGSESSPAVNAGISLTEISRDFSGTVRPQGSGWDMGAFEFTTAAVARPGFMPPSARHGTSQVVLGWVPGTLIRWTKATPMSDLRGRLTPGGDRRGLPLTR